MSDEPIDFAAWTRLCLLPYSMYYMKFGLLNVLDDPMKCLHSILRKVLTFFSGILKKKNIFQSTYINMLF